MKPGDLYTPYFFFCNTYRTNGNVFRRDSRILELFEEGNIAFAVLILFTSSAISSPPMALS